MSSVWDTFVEGSYIINKDFTMTAHAVSDFGTANVVTLSNGINFMETEDKIINEFVVTQIHTLFSGTCYQIKSNVSIPPPYSVSIIMNVTESLNKEDLPQVM